MRNSGSLMDRSIKTSKETISRSYNCVRCSPGESQTHYVVKMPLNWYSCLLHLPSARITTPSVWYAGD